MQVVQESTLNSIIVPAVIAFVHPVSVASVVPIFEESVGLADAQIDAVDNEVMG